MSQKPAPSRFLPRTPAGRVHPLGIVAALMVLVGAGILAAARRPVVGIVGAVAAGVAAIAFGAQALQVIGERPARWYGGALARIGLWGGAGLLIAVAAIAVARIFV